MLLPRGGVLASAAPGEEEGQGEGPTARRVGEPSRAPITTPQLSQVDARTRAARFPAARPRAHDSRSDRAPRRSACCGHRGDRGAPRCEFRRVQGRRGALRSWERERSEDRSSLHGRRRPRPRLGIGRRLAVGTRDHPGERERPGHGATPWGCQTSMRRNCSQQQHVRIDSVSVRPAKDDILAPRGCSGAEPERITPRSGPS